MATTDFTPCMKYLLKELEKGAPTPDETETLCNAIRAELGLPQNRVGGGVALFTKVDLNAFKRSEASTE